MAKTSGVHYISTVKAYGIKQEFITPYTPEQNGMIERFIRTIKEKCIYQNRYESLTQARLSIGQWVTYYNEERPHQSLKMKTPADYYQELAV